MRAARPMLVLGFLVLAGGLAAFWLSRPGAGVEAPAVVPSLSRAQEVGASPRCRPGWRDLRSDRIATYGVVRAGTSVYRRPGGTLLARFGRLNQNRAATVFELLGVWRDRSCRALWYRVQVPLRPNGSTGYVRPLALSLGTVKVRILVDLSLRRLTLFRSGRVVMRTTVAVGAASTPTPTGRFYVNQRLVPRDPAGPFGPGAIGISAFSNVLTGWAQGGPVAIHGTNAPWSIGLAVSNGCIRVRNDALRRLFTAAPAGTPVTIQS
ncbi:MAG: L,D-transpeptidase [Gaiellaceae bacterium]